MSTDRSKVPLRNKIRQVLRRIKSSSRKKKDKRIMLRLIQSPAYERSQKIAVYLSKGLEVDTKAFIRYALKDGKEIFAPKVVKEKKMIQLYRIKDLRKDLRMGEFGILEPRALEKRRSQARWMDMIVVPGLGFDSKGRRLGRGGGYYDRFLSKAKKVKKVGVAFKEQILKRVPVGTHDIKVNQVITD